MTFTYNLTSANDITRMRYHVRDTDSAAAMFQDEELTFVLNENGGSYKQAVISLLEGKIIELSNTPQFSAGPLSVNYADTRATLMKLLTIKRQEFGIAGLTATANYIYRPDNTNFTEAPTFDSAQDTDWDEDDI